MQTGHLEYCFRGAVAIGVECDVGFAVNRDPVDLARRCEVRGAYESETLIAADGLIGVDLREVQQVSLGPVEVPHNVPPRAVASDLGCGAPGKSVRAFAANEIVAAKAAQ